MTGFIIVLGTALGIGLGFLLPTIPYTASKYLAIAIVAALDSVFGGIASHINKKFNTEVFISGFFLNAILAMLLTYLGQKLNVDIYLASIIVFIGRIFNNLGIVRRYFIAKMQEKSGKKTDVKVEE
jgi:small basic protein